jgi:squamous cell carcinoma antigen recognized by T-cells 3
MPLSVLISNPERKKERTDARANEREIYVAGLSKFTTQEDLEKLFSTVRAFVDPFVR